MKNMCARGVPALVLLAVLYALPVMAQPPSQQPILTVPVTGAFQGNGNFVGNISISRFEQRGTQVVAVGFVSGVLSRANRTLGTAVAGEIAWPVRVRSGAIDLARGPQFDKPAATMIAFTRPVSPGLMLAQSTPPCQVLDVNLAPMTINLLGAQVALGAVSLSLSGQTGPLGDLICSASDLLGNVAGIVNLLNSILSLVTGLLGGLLGGLGGLVP